MSQNLIKLIFYIILINITVILGSTILTEIPKRNRDDTTIVIDSNVFHDNVYGLTYYYAICNKWNYPLKQDCSIYRSIYDNKTVANEFYCNFTLTGQENSAFDKDIKILSISYSYYRGIIVKWLELKYDIVTDARYTILRRDICITEELTLPINKTLNDPSYLNDLAVYDKYSDVNIYISSKTYCSGYEKCVIEYDTEHGKIKTVRPFDYNLTSITVIQDSKVSYFIRGYDNATKNYKILGINDEQKIMYDMIIVDRNTEFINSKSDEKFGATFCQVKSRTEKSTKVNCLHLTNGNTILTDSTFEIPAAVKLLETKAIKQSTNNSLLLLTERINCKRDDCWNVIIAIDEINKPVEIREHKFDCNGDRKNLVIYNVETVFNEKSQLIYGCEKLVDGDESKSYFHIGKVDFEYEDLYSDKCADKKKKCISFK